MEVGMKLIVLACLMVGAFSFADEKEAAAPTPKKITVFSRTDAVLHVLQSKGLADLKTKTPKLQRLDLSELKVESSGEATDKKFELELVYKQSGEVGFTTCTVDADVSVEILKKGRPVITTSQLSEPKFGTVGCAN
jgi:hypothetical protein